jgi:hypothetical protein
MELQGVMLPGVTTVPPSPVVGRAVTASGMFPPPKADASPVADDCPNGPAPAVGARSQPVVLAVVAPPRSLGEIDRVPSPLKIAPVPSGATPAGLGHPPPRSVEEGLSPPTNRSVEPSGIPAPSRAAAAALAPGGAGAAVPAIAGRPGMPITLLIEGAVTCAKPVPHESRTAAAMINRPTTILCLRTARTSYLWRADTSLHRPRLCKFAPFLPGLRKCGSMLVARCCSAPTSRPRPPAKRVGRPSCAWAR